MTARTFDAIVLGGGPGGYVAAIRLGQLGARVALVEKDAPGGVCLFSGCIPSKAIIHAASFYDEAAAAQKMGFAFGEVTCDVKKMQAWKGRVIERLAKGVQGLLKAAGVEVVKGTGRLDGPGRVQVEGGIAPQTLEAKDVIVATGSRPIALPSLPFDGKRVISSTEALSLDKVPKNLVVIGGGYIGMELGSAYQKLGSSLVVVELLDQILPGTDPELVEVVRERLLKRGTVIHTGARAGALTEAGLSVTTRDGETVVPADVVLVTVGRRPNSDGLGLEDAGVKLDPKGTIVVDERRQTKAPGIWAIGDVAGGPLLAHKASREGIVAAEAIRGMPSAFDVRCIPWVVFTDPEIAGVGLAPAEAEAKGRTIRVGRFPFASLGRALATGHAEGFCRIVSDAKTDEVLGVHIVGPHASELVAEAALAIELGAAAEDLALTIHAHPTMAEAMMEAAEASFGHAIHLPVPRK